MYLFRKLNIVSRLASHSAKYEDDTGKPPTDVVLTKEELKEVYDYFKDYPKFLMESYNAQQTTLLGLTIHAEYEGNTNFRMIDYK